MTCEKCWGDAYLAAYLMGGDQISHYRRLLNERRDSPCSPREQAGQFWDEARGRDSRKSGDIVVTSRAGKP